MKWQFWPIFLIEICSPYSKWNRIFDEKSGCSKPDSNQSRMQVFISSMKQLVYLFITVSDILHLNNKQSYSPHLITHCLNSIRSINSLDFYFSAGQESKALPIRVETEQRIYVSHSLCLPPSIHSHISASLMLILFQPASVPPGLTEKSGFLKLCFMELKVLTTPDVWACSLTSSSSLRLCLHYRT